MTRTRLALVIAISMASVACASPSPRPHGHLPRLANSLDALPATFVAISQSASEAPHVEMFSASTGQPLGAVPGLPTGSQLQSLQVSSTGAIWVTASRGPRDRNGTLGGDPAPNSCSSSVVTLATPGAQPQKVWTFPSSQWVGDAVPSPSGRRVAYLSASCASSFADAHVVLRSRRGDIRLTLGSNAITCHVLSTPFWSPNGQEVTFTYSASSLTAASPPPIPGDCPEWHPGELAVVGTGKSTGTHGFRLLAASAGCGFRTSAFDRWGLVAIETCGYMELGPAYLEQFSPRLRLERRVPLMPGSDPTSLSVSPGGEFVLVDEYQAPSTSGPALPWDWVWIFNWSGLRLVRRYPDVRYGLSQASW